MTVHGASMGLVTYTGRAREGHTGCEATEWESETSVRCMVTHGARGTRRLVMTVGEQGGGSVTQGWSADVGALSVMRGQNRAGTGSASVTVHGASMGLVTYTGRAREGHTGCEATEWESETSVRCMVTHGARGTRRLVMTVGEQGGGSVTQGWSADVGALSVMRGQNRAGTGSASVTVHGASMGLVTYTGRAREGHTGCEATEWESETSVRCMVTHGARGTRRLVMTVGEQGGGSVTQGWSADVGALSVMRGQNRAGTGSASVTVHGASMGLVTYTGRAREGHTGCEATEWESETSVRCMVTHGARGTRRLVMTVGEQGGGSVTQGWSADVGALSVMRGQNRAGTGSASVTVHGASMGLVTYTGRAREGHTGCEATEWESETSVRCMVTHGARGTRRLVMTVGERGGGSVTQGWSADVGALSVMRGQNRAGTGSASVTVHGASMGLVTYTGRAREGHTGCEATEWESETSVRCMVTHGARGTRRLVMTVGEQGGGSVTQGWSADVGALSVMRGQNRAGTGSASVTVHGASMGLVTYTGRAREGHTGCEATEWESETSVRCMVTHGARGTRRLVMTVGERGGGSVTQGWSADVGALSVMRGQNRAGTGSASVTVHGASMGLVTYTGRAREGHTGCEATEWESETSVRCMVTHGARGTRRLVMTVGEQGGGSVTQGWSADVGALSVMRGQNRAGTGSASVTVHGASMGLVTYTGRAREGHTGCEATEWESETSVRCMVTHGARGTRRLVMTVGERGGGSVTQGWSADVGALSVMRGQNRAGTGSASVTVHGASMGLVTYTGRAREGHTGCEATEWESETSVRCMVTHGARGTRRLVMTVGEQGGGSVTQGWSADVGALSVMRGQNRAGTGSASVTVHGASMGLVTYTGRAREGHTGCEATEWESETSVRCMVTHGARGTRRLVMTVGERGGGSVTQGWSADVGGLSVMRRQNRAGTGSASVTVHGASMGLVTYTGRAREGHTGCEATEWESETSVRCMVTHGARGTRRLVMTVGERGGGSVTQGWSADVGALSVMRRQNRAGTGSASVTVHGASMGLVTYTGRAREGHTGCEATEWESETSVRCMVTHGARGTRRLVMTVGERGGGSVTQGWSADVGGLSVMRRQNRAGTGSASVTVHGASMGLVTYTGRAREGHTGCEATEWESETSVRCMVTHGARGTRRLVMTVGERGGGSVTQGWSADVGGLSVMRRQNRAGTGSASVTVHGASMGLVTYTGRAREGHTGCEATEWESETSVRCMVTHGARGTRRLVMTVGERGGGSVTQGWSADVGGLSVMRRQNRAGTGSASVTVHGASMGLVTYTGRAREGHTGCEATEWESETSVRCMVTHGARGTRRLVMTVGERGGGSVTQGWSADVGGLSVMRRQNRAGTGSASVTVHGASMGLVTYTGRAREGHTGCEATEWESETSVRCMVTHGARGTRRLVMTVGERGGGSVTQGWSADVGGLSVMRRQNRAGTGSASVTVHGASMGLVTYTGRAREGHTGCEATEWESETSVRCMVTHGARGTRRLVMTVGERGGGSVTQGWSADVGGLSVMRRQNRAGTGSASVTVHGASMGLVTYTGRAREGHTGCEATEWESETSVRCMVTHGARGTRRVVMTVGERGGGSVTQGWSADVGGLSVMRRQNRAGTGSASVTVHGASMGLVTYTGRAREGHTGCEATEWESETSVRCMVTHGARGTRRLVMTVGERGGGSVTQGWSADVGGLSVMRRQNRAGTGSASVTVHGASMGLVTYTGRAREGHTGCEATEWESETSVRCMVTHGARGTRRLVMTVGERGGGSVTQGWSADVGGLSVMRRQNRAGTGSASVTVHGASMGLVTYTGRAREGHTGCEATEWESETSVRCMVTHGARGTRRLVMTVGERGGGSVTQGWSADVGGLSVMRRQNRAGTGSASVTVHGASMGLVTYTGRAREGHTGCEATEWESETSVRCMVTHGARGTRRVVMTVGERGGGSVTQGWSADVGGLSVMRRQNRAGTGSASVTVHGASMGLVTYTGRAREGHTGCEATEWESETSVRCMVTHGARGTRRVVMTVGERGGGSVTQGWSADVGGLSVMRRQNRAGTGSASVTVHGASMGLVTYTGRAREGHTGCEATEWESETSVRCMVTHGARGTRRLVMTVGERGGGSVTQGWSADVGGLSVMRRQNRAGTGSASVTVHGASMGLVTYTGRAREGHTGCEATEWESETSVRCMVTHGARGTRRVVMTVGERGGSVTQAGDRRTCWYERDASTRTSGRRAASIGLST